MKKLVKLRDDFRLTEIDWKATRRQADKLGDYIANAPEVERVKYEYDRRLLPLIDAVINGSIEIPYFGPDPYNARFIMEGQAPDLEEKFKDVYYKFRDMIGASSSIFSLSTHEDGQYTLGKYEIERDGELYEWCWFED